MSSMGCLIAVGVGVVLVASCGYFGFQWSTGILEDTVQNELADNPVILEHLGELQSVSVDLKGTGDKRNLGGLVFNLTGAKGSGRLIVKVADKAAEDATAAKAAAEASEASEASEGEEQEVPKMITAGILELPSGETYQIFPDHPLVLVDPEASPETPEAPKTPEVPEEVPAPVPVPAGG